MRVHLNKYVGELTRYRTVDCIITMDRSWQIDCFVGWFVHTNRPSYDPGTLTGGLYVTWEDFSEEHETDSRLRMVAERMYERRRQYRKGVNHIAKRMGADNNCSLPAEVWAAELLYGAAHDDAVLETTGARSRLTRVPIRVSSSQKLVISWVLRSLFPGSTVVDELNTHYLGESAATSTRTKW